MSLSRSQYLQPLYWGILHGVNDMAAGFLLASYTLTHNYSDSFLFVSLYAIMGFGGQLPVGFWLDKKKDINLFAKIAVSLLPLAILISFVSPSLGILCSGVASAFVHVTGGTICLQVHDNKSGPLGLFTAPGVLGLTVGGLLGDTGTWLPMLLVAASLILILFIFRHPLPVYSTPDKKESEIDSHDFIMLLILLLMCFRSFLFDVVNYVAEYYEDGVLYIGLSAFAGKVIGGFMADKIGTKKFIYISLLSSLVFFQIGKENIYMLCGGVALLQSSVPVTLLMMSRSLPFHPATATAFSLGISIAMAGLPLFLVSDKMHIARLFQTNWLTALFFALLLIILFAGGRLMFRKMYG